MILRPSSEVEARRIFEKWELDFAVIGRVTETGRLVLRMNGEIAADIPVEPLVTAAPVYQRPWLRRDPQPEIDLASLPDRDPLECLRCLVASPTLASKRWIWEQYDHLVMGNTVKRPGGDAGVVRVSASFSCASMRPKSNTYGHRSPKNSGESLVGSWRQPCSRLKPGTSIPTAGFAFRRTAASAARTWGCASRTSSYSQPT